MKYLLTSVTALAVKVMGGIVHVTSLSVSVSPFLENEVRQRGNKTNVSHFVSPMNGQ